MSLEAYYLAYRLGAVQALLEAMAIELEILTDVDPMIWPECRVYE